MGPELTDFTLTVDSRMQSEGQAGDTLFFRNDDNKGYVLFATAERMLALGSVNGDVTVPLAVAMPPSLDLSGGVNRTTIHCVGDTISIWINGAEVIRAAGLDQPEGPVRDLAR